MSLRPFFSPNVSTSKGNEKSEVQEVRERILRYVMLFIAGACIGGYLFLGISALTQGNILPFFIYSILTVIVVYFALSRRISFKVQAYILVLAIYAAGFYAYMSAGLVGDGKLYMLGFTVLTGILLGFVPSILALVLSVLTTAGFGFGMVGGSISVPPQNWMAVSTDATGWLIATIFLGSLGVLTTISLTVLVRSLQSSLKSEKSAAEEAMRQRENLELSEKKATQDVERRILQIRTASEISRFISSLQDSKTLLKAVADQIQQQFNLYYVGIFLVDINQFAVLGFGTGEAGQKMMAAGHRLQIGGSSMIGWCIANRESRIALDVGSEAVRFNNPYLPETHSELALPIVSRGESLGALTIQSKQTNAFDENDIRILQGIADSLAISLENAKLLERTQQSLEEIRSLNRTYLLQGWTDAVAINGEISYTYENEPRGNVLAGNRIQLPMTLRDQTIGQITLETEQKEIAPDDLEFIEAIVIQTALALENARLIDETQRKALQEATVNRLSAEFSRGLNIDEIISSAMKEISQLPSVSEVSIFLGTPELTAQTDNNGHNLESAA